MIAIFWAAFSAVPGIKVRRLVFTHYLPLLLHNLLLQYQTAPTLRQVSFSRWVLVIAHVLIVFDTAFWSILF
jgi:hypothetical protein